ESAPSTGENINCISAQTVPNSPKISAASAVSPPRKPSTSFGSTGMMIPNARTSTTTVMKMKTSAAPRAFATDFVSATGFKMTSQNPGQNAGQIDNLPTLLQFVDCRVIGKQPGALWTVSNCVSTMQLNDPQVRQGHSDTTRPSIILRFGRRRPSQWPAGRI